MLRTCFSRVALVVTLGGVPAFVATADAQVLTTADTLGRGKTGVLLSENEIRVDTFRLNIAYGEYAHGLTDRFDLYAAAGETTTEGLTQFWIGGGGNVHLAKIRRVSLSAFNIASVPLTRRDQACRLLLNSALVASMPVRPNVFVYSGVNSLIPIADRARGVFTPPDTKFNVPIGATIGLGPWGIWGELDAGPLHAVGVGVTRLF
jgi:hypothetical protein